MRSNALPIAAVPRGSVDIAVHASTELVHLFEETVGLDRIFALFACSHPLCALSRRYWSFSIASRSAFAIRRSTFAWTNAPSFSFSWRPSGTLGFGPSRSQPAGKRTSSANLTPRLCLRAWRTEGRCIGMSSMARGEMARRTLDALTQFSGQRWRTAPRPFAPDPSGPARRRAPKRRLPRRHPLPQLVF
jgi:hypothetical protein